ncbi:MAG TPA: hypothetical protein VHD90_27670, partial [Phototrophicaceae bacterium]|nr:hypothetical protein [Phototrophicaceae bacterium]
MFRRLLIVLSTVFCALAIIVPAAQADCSLTGGTSPNNTYTCNGNDPNGLDVGSGNDAVDILSGTVKDTITSGGGRLVIHVNGGALNTTNAGDTAIEMDGNGRVFLFGSIKAGYNGIYINGSGQVFALGDI